MTSRPAHVCPCRLFLFVFPRWFWWLRTMRLLPTRLCEFCSGRVSGSGPAERSRAERGGLDRSPAPRRHVAQGEAARAGWDSAFRPPSCRPASAAFMVSLHHHTHTHTHTRSHTNTYSDLITRPAGMQSVPVCLSHCWALLKWTGDGGRREEWLIERWRSFFCLLFSCFFQWQTISYWRSVPAQGGSYFDYAVQKAVRCVATIIEKKKNNLSFEKLQRSCRWRLKDSTLDTRAR